MAQRAPTSQPLCLAGTGLVAPVGHFRGQGVGRGVATAGASPAGRAAPPDVSKYVSKDPLTKAIQAAQAPHRHFQTLADAHIKSQKQYIPGLDPKPEVTLDATPVSVANAPRKVPPSLVKAFLKGQKNPVSALMEYCTLVRSTVSFREATVNRTGANTFQLAKFANVCSVDGEEFLQGVGSTKKEAKTEAAKIAFIHILGVEIDDVHGENSGDIILYDVMGRACKLIEPPSAIDQCPPPVEMDEMAPEELNEALNAACVENLRKYCQERRLPLVICTTISKTMERARRYVTYIVIDKEGIASGCAKNAKDSKRLACLEALDIMVVNEVETSVHCETIHDQIMQISHKAITNVMMRTPKACWGGSIVSTFCVKLNPADTPKVIAIATGSSSLEPAGVKQDGRRLVDAHAEVVAKRSFCRYLYSQLNEYIGGSQTNNIFTTNKLNGKLKVKDDVSVHLYVSNAPEGDACSFLDIQSAPLTAQQVSNKDHIPNFSDELAGLLTATAGQDDIAKAVKIFTGLETPRWAELMSGCPVYIMSASDKILSWNILGIQGSLLANFIDPVYLSTITIGQHFDHGHMCRAFCCRVYNELEDALPPSYKINHPDIGGPACYRDQCNTLPLNELSINWIDKDSNNEIEVVNASSGLTVPDSPFKSGVRLASRLCKAAFLSRYRQLTKLAKREANLSAPTYWEAKLRNKNYQLAKEAFRKHLVAADVGAWICKPRELEMFTE